ncbi:MAG: Ig-like domain-containing protein [Chloroflexota bacterium]
MTGARIASLVAICLLLAPVLAPIRGQAASSPPVVIGWQPGVSAGVSPDSSLSLLFNQPMNQASVESAWHLAPSTAGTFHWNDSTVTFRPSGQLRPGTVYRLSIAASARARTGAFLGQSYSLRFTTSDALRVSSVSPARGTTQVPLDGRVTITFNHPMVPLSGLSSPPSSPPDFHVSMYPRTAGSGAWLGTSTWAFYPKNGLAPSTSYRMALRSGVRDSSGDRLARGIRWSFSTIAPEVYSISPRRGSRYNNPRSAVRITFDQPMDRSSTAGAFSLRHAGRTIAGSASWSGKDRIFTFRPARDLGSGDPYIASIKRFARSADGSDHLRRSVRWTFAVAPPPAITGSSPKPGGVSRDNCYGCAPQGAGYVARVYFDEPMNKRSLDRHLHIQPQAPHLFTYFGSRNSGTHFQYVIQASFRPSTAYTVSLSAGVRDPFGRELPGAFSVSFTTSPYTASAILYGQPYQQNVISLNTGQPTRVPVQTVNASRVHYELIKTELSSLLQNGCCGKGPPAGKVVHSWTAPVSESLNKIAHFEVDLVRRDGSALSPGLYWLTAHSVGHLAGAPVNHTAPPSSEAVVLTNIGLTQKAGSHRTLVWVTSAETGEPLPNVPIQLLGQRGSVKARGTTNGQGVFIAPQGQSSYLSAQVQSHGLFGIVEPYWQPPSSASNGSSFQDPWIPINYQGGSGGGYLYTDRPIYRPGQRVHFRGLLWRDRDGVYSQFGQQVVATVKAFGTRGKLLYQRRVPLNRFGTVHGSFVLPRQASTGFASINVGIRRESAGTSFSVADYSKPEVLANVRSSKKSYIQKQTLLATAHVSYVFGGPVRNQKITWVAYSQPISSWPPGWGPYSFFDEYAYWQSPGSDSQSQFGDEVASGHGETDNHGNVKIRWPVKLAKSRLDHQITVEATATDLNHQPVSGRVTVTAYRAGFSIGLQAPDGVVAAGRPVATSIAAVDHSGQPVSGQSLKVVVARRTFSNKLVTSNGYTAFQDVSHDHPLQTRTVVTNASGKATVTFTPPQGGEYVVKISGNDTLGNTAHGLLIIDASSAGSTDWGNAPDQSIVLKSDKSEYRVGQTAHIAVPAPFANAEALITLERGTIRSYRVTQLSGATPVIDVPITLDDIPNLFVTVTLYRGWRDGSQPDWRYGSAELKVKIDPRKIKIHLAANGAHHKPGDRVTYTVTTTDSHGHPLSAQLSLALVDTSVLALKDAGAPNILQALYGLQMLGVSTSSQGAISIDHLSLPPGYIASAQGPGEAYLGVKSTAARPVEHAPNGADQGAIRGPAGGGGGGGGGSPPTVRSRFADTAFWRGALVTAANGQAEVTVRLPDNTTTWQLDARAVGSQSRVGQARLDTVSTRDLILRPILPRFFLRGDLVSVGTILNNTTSRPVTAGVEIVASHLRLRGTTARLVVPPHGERSVMWRGSVERGKYSGIVLRALSHSSGIRGDAIETAVPIHLPQTGETVATAGTVLGSVKEPVIVPRNATTHGDLTVQVSASLIAGLGSAYRQLHPSQNESVENVADRVEAAASLRGLPFSITGLSRGSYRHLPEVVAAGVQKLLDSQNGDGGWTWYPGGYYPSDPFITADALQALARSREHGRLVERVISSARRFLSNQQGTVTTAEWAHILLVLAQSGGGYRYQTESLDRNSIKRLHLSAEGLADLGLALTLYGRRKPAENLGAALDGQAMVSSTGAHWEGTASTWGSTAVANTAAVLQALLTIRPHDSLVPAAARWLMLSRSGAGWDSTLDSARAIATLAEYGRQAREGHADFTYRVAVNAGRHRSGSYQANNQRHVSQLSVPISKMHRSRSNDVQINRTAVNSVFGSGPLYYLTRLHYYLPATNIAPLDQGLSVHRQYFSLSGRSIQSIPAGSAVRVRLTVHTDQTLMYLDIEDPLPAGLEPIDESLNTSQQGLVRPQYLPFSGHVRDLNWYLTYSDLRNDRVSLYVSTLPPGTYRYSYLAQAIAPGRFEVSPTRASETFFPEVFGRSSGQMFSVR